MSLSNRGAISEHRSTPVRKPLRPEFFSNPDSPPIASAVYLNNQRTSVGSRKRPRPESPTSSSSKTLANARHQNIPGQTSYHVDPSDSTSASRLPLVNSRYRLAGGLDTPTAAAAAKVSCGECASIDRNFRTGWALTPTASGRQAYIVEGLDREHNGRVRVHRSMAEEGQDELESWSRFMFRVAGGLAGKVWDFCRPGAFRGFVAGGGPAYAVKAGASHVEDTQNQKISRSSSRRGSTPVPGRYPIDQDYETVTYQDAASESSSPRPPPSKRLQIAHGTDWVVINNSPRLRASTSTSSNTQRPASAASLRPDSPLRSDMEHHSKVPRPVSRRTTSRMVSLRRPSSRTSSASLATTTPPKLSIPQPLARNVSCTSPRVSSSVRSACSGPSSRSAANLTPPSVEAARFAAARAKQERQTDASVRRLNSQLTAMIKEGQAALASKVEVTDEDDDLCMVEEASHMDESMIDEGYSEGYDGFYDILDLNKQHCKY